MTRIVDTDHARVGAWMHRFLPGTWREGATCIGLERNGELVAATLYDGCNGASIYSNIVIDGLVSREWLWFIFYYPFVQLNVNVILGLVAKNNVKSQHLVEHLGFHLLTEIPDADPSGATLLYTMPKQRCKWIRRRQHG